MRGVSWAGALARVRVRDLFEGLVPAVFRRGGMKKAHRTANASANKHWSRIEMGGWRATKAKKENVA